MTFPELWGEGTALVDLAYSGATANIAFAAVVNSIDIDMGDKDFDAVTTIRGGRLKKQTPEAECTITFEGYPVSLDTTGTGGQDVWQRFFTKSASWDSTQPLAVDNALLKREDFRVCILWTESTSVTSAAGATTALTEALRFTSKRCQLISVKPSFTDNELKMTFKFKLNPFAKTATLGGKFGANDAAATQSNLRWESCDVTSNLAALGDYT